MKIGVDIRELVKTKAGKGWYVFHVLNNIKSIDSNNSYVMYGNVATELSVLEKWNKARFVKIDSNELMWHYKVSKRLKKDRVDLYWAPTSPIVSAITDVPTVMTVHDMTTFLFPGNHTLKSRLVEKIFFGKAIRKTAKIICDSKATKNDLVKFFPQAKNKTAVTYLGFDEAFRLMPDNIVCQTLNKHQITSPYILYVGTIEPRKNLVKLIEAYEHLPIDLIKKYQLVIVGKKGWKLEPIIKKINSSQYRTNIKQLDYVPFSDLPALYNGASVFVFPSLYEGFGLPPLEAMACRTPVITSNVSSLPEVVGKSAILVDPNNITDMVEKIRKILTDSNYRKHYADLAFTQSRKFSWQKTAEEILKIINNCRTND